MPADKVDLGCGEDDREGFVGVDIVDTEAADVVHDLDEFPYPFEDDRFGYILMSHVLEHLEDVVKVMEEVHRIGRDGAVVEIEVPYFTSRSAYGDPTHENFFTYDSFSHFVDEGPYSFYTDARFEMVERKIEMASYPLGGLIERFVNRFPRLHEHTVSRALFPTANIRVKLEVKK
ncbi:MAG: methyltransferase domain-containing protein [Candidatus Nanohaloarchaea archaeon]